MTRRILDAYQFLITLLEVSPLVWRRVVVPGHYTFWDLHVAIQDAMGWEDYHLHQFELVNPRTHRLERIGLPDDEDSLEYQILSDRKERISSYFSYENAIALYRYDFGDGWRHAVAFECVVPNDSAAVYPQCLAGERACPPEDCGGPGGYADFLEAVRDPRHPDHDELLRWIGGKFDPDEFDHQKVVFDDPIERWRIASGEDAPSLTLNSSASSVAEIAKTETGIPAKLIKKLKRKTSILTETEVEFLAANVRRGLDESFMKAYDPSGVKLKDGIRWSSLADRSKQARARRGLNIKDVSTQLKIPRYRLTAIEQGRLSEVKPEIALRYFQFLGIESWVKRWSRANLVLAKRVGIAHANDKVQST
jgi:hypothetical protein